MMNLKELAEGPPVQYIQESIDRFWGGSSQDGGASDVMEASPAMCGKVWTLYDLLYVV